MELMKNKYLKFEEIESGIGLVRNVTTLNLLVDIPKKYFETDYILYKKLEDDRLLEAVSFDIYSNTNYWDILLVLNGMISLTDLPANYDIVLLRAEKRLEDWLGRGSLMQHSLDDDQIKNKYDEFLEIEIEANEKHRDLMYISPNNLSELLGELSMMEDDVKINSDLIINEE